MFDAAIAAAVLPPIIAFINQRHWPTQVKGLVALLTCFLYGLVVLIVRGTLDFTNWRNTVLAVAGVAFVAYKVWWQPSGIAPAIEDTTTLGSERATRSTAEY